MEVVRSNLNIPVHNLLDECMLQMQYICRYSLIKEITLKEFPNGVCLIRAIAESGSVTKRIVVAK